MFFFSSYSFQIYEKLVKMNLSWWEKNYGRITLDAQQSFTDEWFGEK